MFDRKFLQALRNEAWDETLDTTKPEHWKRAFKDLAHAADTLDAMLARELLPKRKERIDLETLPSSFPWNPGDVAVLVITEDGRDPDAAVLDWIKTEHPDTKFTLMPPAENASLYNRAFHRMREAMEMSKAFLTAEDTAKATVRAAFTYFIPVKDAGFQVIGIPQLRKSELAAIRVVRIEDDCKLITNFKPLAEVVAEKAQQDVQAVLQQASEQTPKS